MKQVLIFCDHCEHRINFHDLFRRNGTFFYHALCWELYLLECVDKVRAFKQEHAPPRGPRRHLEHTATDIYEQLTLAPLWPRAMEIASRRVGG
jgi:hypothetical protein